MVSMQSLTTSPAHLVWGWRPPVLRAAWHGPRDMATTRTVFRWWLIKLVNDKLIEADIAYIINGIFIVVNKV